MSHPPLPAPSPQDMSGADAADGWVCRIAALSVFPIKSCGGIAQQEALLTETGLDLDRAWMVVDEHGDMLTQRELPRMALIQPAWRGPGEVVLRAPGMLALHLRVDTVESATRVRVWDDVVKAYDMGALAAQWFTDFLGRRLRLVRFDPEQQRPSDPRWAGELAADNAFSDGFPLLVTSLASLGDLNARLHARGQGAVEMSRFRPNIVLEGLQPFDEDHVRALVSPDGSLRLRLVKPCVRCGIPNVDPATAALGAEPGATLATYRADPRMKGGITFGINAVVERGLDSWLRVGQVLRAEPDV